MFPHPRTAAFGPQLSGNFLVVVLFNNEFFVVIVQQVNLFGPLYVELFSLTLYVNV